ncbi:hypothetical protein LZ554_008872 [Drepanopeziza brunnea f. sp. 'monogermtubi']|nr:hypothetical protein LZ554_008872 [Drepanopeziza brunnea f. sp. 'monogermtubi']
MAIEKVDILELIHIDKDYYDRVEIRRRIVAHEIQSAIQVSPACKYAIDELYTFLVTKLLPEKYPNIFKLVGVSSDQSNRHTITGSLLRSATQSFFPLIPPQCPITTMKYLATLVDEDFIFLLPSESGYTMQGYLICFSSGFLSATDGAGMIGKSLSEIHREVPGYQELLRSKMERWTERMKPGTFWRRCNWTITMNGKLRNEVGENQVYATDAHATSVKLNLSQAHLRTELQIVQKLPQTGAILFTYKTYVYPLSDIKKEGNGPALADAIDGLRKGNVPGMFAYKGAGIWGESVMEYLRQ